MSMLGYPVIGRINTSAGSFPLVYIPMMSDEEWQRLASENAVHNYIRENGHEPENVETAEEWLKKWLAGKEIV